MSRSFLLVLFSIISLTIQSQNTVGLLSYDENKSFDGYNLYYPHNQNTVYLINNCGEIVHSWVGEEETVPGNTAYILPDGKLVKTSRPRDFSSDRIWAGGGGATIEIRDWDNNIEWSYTLNNDSLRLHHDIALVPKQDNKFNILMIVWEVKDLNEVIQAGRDTSVLQSMEMWPDFIQEVDPETDEIVWEWHVWDHLIQDFDDTKDNFGDVGANPQLVDVNLDLDGMGRADWMHTNSIDYDEMNDLIAISIPYFSEIFVIDHSTTTAQAASNTGGLGGRGGDLLYRWGNNQNYRQGDETSQTLFFQHDANFIDDFIDPVDPLFGKLAIFNNRIAPNYSGWGILNHGFDMYEFKFPFSNEKFEPEELESSFLHPVDTFALFSTGLSSFQYLPNGNHLVCSGRFGYAFEVTPDDEIVWEYITPLRAGLPVEQGMELEINNNLTFRVYRYPATYSAFDGKDLTSKGWLELNPDETFCQRLTSVNILEEDYGMNIFPNPADDMITITWEAGKYINMDILDVQGRQIIETMQLTGGRKYLNTRNWNEGLYLIRINGKTAGKIMIMR